MANVYISINANLDHCHRCDKFSIVEPITITTSCGVPGCLHVTTMELCIKCIVYVTQPTLKNLTTEESQKVADLIGDYNNGREQEKTV